MAVFPSRKIVVPSRKSTITITGSGVWDRDGVTYAKCTIDGVDYVDCPEDVTLELPAGTVITLYVANNAQENDACIKVNGTVVAFVTKSGGSVTYEYVVSSSATIWIHTPWVAGDGYTVETTPSWCGQIDITEV